MENMSLYEKLKDLKVVDNLKEFSELVWLRSIKINDELVTDPKTSINTSNQNIIKIGFTEIII